MSKIMSFAIGDELQDKLRTYSKRKGLTYSQCVRELVDKFVVDDDTVIPVILKIPVELKGDSEALRSWCEAKTNAIVDKLS